MGVVLVFRVMAFLDLVLRGGPVEFECEVGARDMVLCYRQCRGDIERVLAEEEAIGLSGL